MKNPNVTLQTMYGCPVFDVKNSMRHNLTNTQEARIEIIDALMKETNIVQLHDFGSIIGEIVGRRSMNINAPDEIDDFVDSFSHGVSTATGTHDRNEANKFTYIKKYYVEKMVRSEKLDAIFHSTLWGMVAGGLLMAAIFVFG